MSSSISEFYQGKQVFVFGATTFPGKVLLEKLLRSCPTIEKIYCPVGPHKQPTRQHLSPADTFAEIYASKLFDRVRRSNARFQEKIVPFDICLLSETGGDDVDANPKTTDTNVHCRHLQENIDLCFYIGNDSIDFDEQNLKDLIQSNVMDFKTILGFLKTCTALKSIVYLSSIYANIGMNTRQTCDPFDLCRIIFRLSIHR
jgi:alcohol-forming fatty acyl-CoA reductase